MYSHRRVFEISILVCEPPTPVGLIVSFVDFLFLVEFRYAEMLPWFHHYIVTAPPGREPLTSMASPSSERISDIARRTRSL